VPEYWCWKANWNATRPILYEELVGGYWKK